MSIEHWIQSDGETEAPEEHRVPVPHCPKEISC